jgi:hypothetical protein
MFDPDNLVLSMFDDNLVLSMFDPDNLVFSMFDDNLVLSMFNPDNLINKSSCTYSKLSLN